MLLLFGLAGSGKSTQGRILAAKYGWKWISAGQVLRDAKVFDEIMARGELVDDDIVIDLMLNEIKQAKQAGLEVIIDGFPRNEYQAKVLLGKVQQEIKKAVYIEVPKEELWHRLVLRDRQDDTEESVKKRFAIIEQNIYAIISLLESHNIKVAHIDGSGSREQVTERLTKEIEQ